MAIGENIWAEQPKAASVTSRVAPVATNEPKPPVRYIADVVLATDSTPELEYSILRNRVKSIYVANEDGTIRQVGMASKFHLRNAGKNVLLACIAEIDGTEHDRVEAELSVLSIDETKTLSLGTLA